MSTDEVFEKRKGMSCFAYRNLSHLCYSCPELKKKTEKSKRINQLAGLEGLDEIFEPFMSRVKVNGRELNILRDSGSSIEVI